MNASTKKLDPSSLKKPTKMSTRRNPNAALPHPGETIIPSTEILQHSEIEWRKPLRYERGEPVARRIGMHDRLVKSEKITTEEWLWVSRYCLDMERVEGARPGKPDVEIDRPYNGTAIYDGKAMAASFLRLSDSRMTTKERDLVISSCVKAHRVCDVAIICGLKPTDDETVEQFSKRVDAKVKTRVVAAIRKGAGVKSDR